MYALLAFAAYLLFALIRWPFLNMANTRQQQRAAATNQDDQPTLREILHQPAAQHRPGSYIDSSLELRSDGRGRIEPRL
jgi:hypothetical protein